MSKILLIVPSATGTIGRCSYNLYLALSRLPQVEVRVFLLRKTSKDAFDFGSPHYISGGNALWERFTKIFRGVATLRALKKQWTPDVSIGTLNVCSVYNLLSGGRDKKIGIFHGEFSWKTMEHKSIVALLWGKLCYRFLFPHLDYRVAVSARVKELTDGYVGNKNKSCVIYNAHDIDSIVKQAEHPLPEHERGIFDKDVVLVVGALVANKGICRLIKAFSVVKKTHSNLNLVFLGRDLGEKEKSISLAESLGVEESVFFIAHTVNPYPYIKKSKLLVSASYSEGLPGVLCEAGVLNVPVVATNSSAGVWETLDCIEDYKPNLEGCYFAKKGIVVQNRSKPATKRGGKGLTGDEIALAEAISRYLSDFRFYAKAKSSDNPFLDKIRFEAVARQFLSLIEGNEKS